MLKKLPIISSRTSKKFTYYSYFISMAPPIIPLLLYSVSDTIIMQE